MTDALKVIGENVARISGGSYMKARYIEIIDPKPEETRTKDEIINHMKNILSSL